MRILILNSEYPPLGGGAGNASANLARALADQGQDVSVLTVQFPGLAREETQNGIQIRRIRAIRKYQDRSGPFEQLSFMLSGFLHILPIVRAWKPDVIIAFFGVPSGAVAWFAHLVTGVPYIVSLRGGDVPGFRPYDFKTYHRLMGPLIRRIWQQAGAVVANSKGLRDLGGAFDSCIPIEIIPNGVDVDRFTPVPRSWNPARMLFVGRIVYQKGLDILIQALSGLADMEWQLTMVGDGTQRLFLVERAQSWGILERIIFTGWQTGDKVLKHYRDANLYVAPSRHEGMPNVVLEAMASGLPVVASEIAGNEELVSPGVNGMLVPCEDVTALQDCLRDILSRPDMMEEMGGASRQIVEEGYTWSAMAAQYLALAERIVGK